jgi:hypothetical protein
MYLCQQGTLSGRQVTRGRQFFDEGMGCPPDLPSSTGFDIINETEQGYIVYLFRVRCKQLS